MHMQCKICRHPDLRGTHSVVAFNESSRGLQAFIAVNDRLQTIIVVFRGRFNLQNTKSVFEFSRISLSYDYWGSKARVHSGFLKNYLQLKPKIQPVLINYLKKYPKYDLVYTGHSMGGALASIAVVDAIKPRNKIHSLRSTRNISLYTIGQPRVGNEEFANLIEKSRLKHVLRAVNYTDPVPHLPLEILGFRHFKKEIFIDQDNIAKFCDDRLGALESSNCLNAIPISAYDVKHHSVYFGAGQGNAADC